MGVMYQGLFTYKTSCSHIPHVYDSFAIVSMSYSSIFALVRFGIFPPYASKATLYAIKCGVALFIFLFWVFFHRFYYTTFGLSTINFPFLNLTFTNTSFGLSSNLTPLRSMFTVSSISKIWIFVLPRLVNFILFS